MSTVQLLVCRRQILASSKPVLLLNRDGYYLPGSIYYARARPVRLL